MLKFAFVIILMFLPVVWNCSVNFHFNNLDNRQSFTARVWGPYLRRSSQKMINPGETAYYLAEGTFFMCTGKYEVLIKGRPGSKEFRDVRYFFFDSTAVLNITEAVDGSVAVNYDVREH
uniref:Uncharacterized protein n=1 Tax=Plectus sambesii TaxID=2011161 RepID=A0A914XLN4_9BILA